RAFHVVGAAADEHSVLDRGRERVAVPAVAGRHYVEVAGKAEMRRSRAAHRDHILGRTVGRLAHNPAMHGEAERGQRGLQQVKNFAASGGDAGASDEIAGECNRVDWRRRSEEHTSELQSLAYLVCRLLLEKKKK